MAATRLLRPWDSPGKNTGVGCHFLLRNQYCCGGCSSNGCWSAYEYCVSCCLKPNKQLLLERFLNRAAVAFQNLFMAVEDHFELCLAKCRTSSQVSIHDASGGRVGQWESTSGRKLENPHWGPFGGGDNGEEI